MWLLVDKKLQVSTPTFFSQEQSLTGFIFHNRVFQWEMKEQASIIGCSKFEFVRTILLPVQS
jgi:ABC-type glycerol-3-phosphate transport system permease component